MFMKHRIIEGLYIPQCDKCGADLSAFAHECPKDIEPGLSTGSRELIFTAFVSEEGINLSPEWIAGHKLGGNTDFMRALNRLCVIARFKADKLPLSVTLKIEPVNVPAQVNAASEGMGHEKSVT